MFVCVGGGGGGESLICCGSPSTHLQRDGSDEWPQLCW